MAEWDHLNAIQPAALRPVFDELAGHRAAASVELGESAKHIRRGEKRRLEDLRQVANVAKLLKKLPKPGESWHMVTKGNFAFWDFVPAILRLAAPARIRYLGIVTLGFSSANVSALLDLIDTRQIARVEFLYSIYFKSNEKEACAALTNQLTERRQTVAAIRTHAKLLLFEMTNRGPAYCIESSANLRSCGNVEQMTLTHDRALVRFHRKWISEVCTKAKE
jgi:hypothetical protein